MSIPQELGPFTGGVNLVDPPTKLSNNELSQCLNIRRGPRGNIYKRPGHDFYGSAPAKVNGNSFINLCLRYYKSDGTKKLIAASGGKLRFGNDSTGAWTDISINGTGATMNASNLCDWMVYKDRLYITDGTGIQRYNGTDNLYAGSYQYPAPTTAQTTGGNLTLLGAYQYFVTSVAGTMGEGIKGVVASITLTLSNNKVNLSNMTAPAGSYEETTKKIYRTKAGGTIFYFLAEIPSGTSTYADITSDTDLVLGGEYVSTHIPPVDARFVIVGHDERTYYFGRPGANASLIDVSDVGFPDRILDSDFISVANNDGDILTGGGLVPGGILFLKKNSAWLSRAFGFGLINIRPREKRGSGVGTTSPFSVVSTPIGLIFLSQQGQIYLFDGTNLTEIGRKVSSEFKGMTTAAMGNVVACYHDFRYIISYDYRGSKGYNWRTLEYDTLTGEWEGPHENGDFYNPSYYSVWDSVLDKGELYWGESKAATGGYVYGRTELTKTDRGQKFLSTIRSASLPYGNLAEVMSIKGFIHGRASDDASISFSHIDELGNKVSVVLSSPVALSAGIWDTDFWDAGIWGGITEKVYEGSLGPSRSRVPIYEISDGQTATEFYANIFQILVEPLPLK